MRKKIVIPGLIILIILIIYGAIQNESNESIDANQENDSEIQAQVIMPTKSSRPNCEQTNGCYIPSRIEISAGESVTWLNEDVAFHSVTGGTYENPNGMFDSGHIDPNDTFTIVFDESGTFDYFCTLHPWMSGQVLVK